jgi:glyoxylase-like metal-dependent hydrolase (beta-lactamase superfamily II)
MGLPLCEVWFESERVDDGVVRIIEPHVHPLLRANAFVVAGRDRDLLIDTGNGIGSIAPVVAGLREEPSKPLLAVATHGHVDHAGGLSAFEDRQAHELDVPAIERLEPLLFGFDESAGIADVMAEAGFPLTELLVTAAPNAAFDPQTPPSIASSVTRVLHEGDVVDLGDRAFEVLHLPGHTPGSVGLWHEGSGTLFSGDAVYIGDPLIDQAPESSIPDYLVTMERLAQLPVRIVHAGHDWSFGREDLIARCRGYIERRGPGSRS